MAYHIVTVCPRSSDPFYVVTYHKRLVKSSCAKQDALPWDPEVNLLHPPMKKKRQRWTQFKKQTVYYRGDIILPDVIRIRCINGVPFSYHYIKTINKVLSLIRTRIYVVA